MVKPLGNPLVLFDEETNSFEPYVEIGFNNLLLNTGLSYPGNNTKYFNVENGIMSVEENNLAISGKALKVSPSYIESMPELQWKRAINTNIINDMCIDNDNNLYIVSSDKSLKKFNIESGGSEIWSYNDNLSNIIHVQVDNEQQNTYILNKDKQLKKISHIGLEIWEYSDFISNPIQIYFDQIEKLLYIIDQNTIKILDTEKSTPELINSVTIECKILSDIKTDDLGNKYILFDGCIRKLDKNFNTIWELICIDDGTSIRSFFVDIDYNVYTCGSDKKIRKTSSSGRAIWEYSLNAFIPTECITDEKGYLYALSSNKSIIKLDPNGNLIWTYILDFVPSHILLDNSNNFFFVDNITYAINKINMSIEYRKPILSQDIRLRPNRIYTLSFLLKASEAGIISVSLDNIMLSQHIEDSMVDKYKEYTFCFKTPSTINTDITYPIKFSLNIISNMYLSDMKLEMGNINTTWSQSTIDERIRYESHGSSNIFDKDGIHGIRYNKDEDLLEVGNGSDWIEIKTGSGSGGIIAGGKEFFTNANEVDPTAEYPIVTANTSNENEVPFFEVHLEDIILGRYSCMFRLRSSNVSISSPLIKIEVFHRLNGVDTKLVEANIRGTDFDVTNTWKTMGFVVDFHGDNNIDKLMVIKGTLLKQIQPTEINLDYIVTNFVYTNVGAIQTIKF